MDFGFFVTLLMFSRLCTQLYVCGSKNITKCCFKNVCSKCNEQKARNAVVKGEVRLFLKHGEPVEWDQFKAGASDKLTKNYRDFYGRANVAIEEISMVMRQKMCERIGILESETDAIKRSGHDMQAHQQIGQQAIDDNNPRILKFSGWYSDWPEFKSNFAKTHEHAELMNYHKLEVLSNALSEEVFELLDDVKDYKMGWRMIKQNMTTKQISFWNRQRRWQRR